MSGRQIGALLAAALFAGCLGVIASVALFGPGPLLRSPLGQQAVVRGWLQRAYPAPTGVTVLLPGDPVPPFALPGLNGPARTLPAPGRATLINYWASWCAPCRSEMPLLDALAHSGAAGDLQVIGIALDDPAPAEDYFRKGQFTFPSLIEPSSDTDSSVRLGDTRGILPYSVLIGADGRLRATHLGAFDDAQALRDWAAKAR